MNDIKKVYITEDKLSSLREIGYGSYGCVFYDEESDMALKIYKETVCCSDLWGGVKNPCLNVDREKIKRLKEKDKLLKYTDTSLELLYMNSKFVGVRLKYYDGYKLRELANRPLVIKKNLVKQLIRNTNELSDNHIYNLDLSVDNVMVTKDGQVKIIDLDDEHTKVKLIPNYIYKSTVLKKLKSIIVEFLFYNQLKFPYTINDKLDNNSYDFLKKLKMLGYSNFYSFVDDISFSENISVNKLETIRDIDIYKFKNYLKENNLDLVLAVDGNRLLYSEYLDEILDLLKRHDISVYDIFKYDKDYSYDEALSDYLVSHECSNFDNLNVKKLLIKK